MQRLAIALTHPAAIPIQVAKFILCRRITLLCGFPVPLCRLGIIFLPAVTFPGFIGIDHVLAARGMFLVGGSGGRRWRRCRYGGGCRHGSGYAFRCRLGRNGGGVPRCPGHFSVEPRLDHCVVDRKQRTADQSRDGHALDDAFPPGRGLDRHCLDSGRLRLFIGECGHARRCLLCCLCRAGELKILQFLSGRFVALLGRHAVPVCRLFVIRVHPVAVLIGVSQGILGLGMSLFGRRAVPLHRLCIVLLRETGLPRLEVIFSVSIGSRRLCFFRRLRWDGRCRLNPGAGTEKLLDLFGDVGKQVAALSQLFEQDPCVFTGPRVAQRFLEIKHQDTLLRLVQGGCRLHLLGETSEIRNGDWRRGRQGVRQRAGRGYGGQRPGQADHGIAVLLPVIDKLDLRQRRRQEICGDPLGDEDRQDGLAEILGIGALTPAGRGVQRRRVQHKNEDVAIADGRQDLVPPDLPAAQLLVEPRGMAQLFDVVGQGFRDAPALTVVADKDICHKPLSLWLSDASCFSRNRWDPAHPDTVNVLR